MKIEFYNELKTAIKSIPIVYIPHSHYSFVDETLTKIITDSELSSELSVESVLEFDMVNGLVDFCNKKVKHNKEYSKLESFLSEFVTGENNVFNSESIVLLKNFAEYFSDIKIQSLLQTFATNYENAYYWDEDRIRKMIEMEYKTLKVLGQEDCVAIEKAQKKFTPRPFITIIIVSPLAPTPKLITPQLEKYISVIDILPPNEDEIKEYLMLKIDTSLKEIDKDIEAGEILPMTKDRIISNCNNIVRVLQGLEMIEIKQILKIILDDCNNIPKSASIQIALNEKQRIIKKSGLLEVCNTNTNFEDVGGLKILKEDLIRKSYIYRHLDIARKHNIPIPKGILIIGKPGCGKSMIAQSIANLFQHPLFRLDITRLLGKYVGESESNLRKALAVAEAAQPCVLWIDEIEKAFAGSNNNKDGKEVLMTRLMSHFLTWMQERTSPVFIVTTANGAMKPEFMRKGRFDEVYFVDFPDEEERVDIFKKTIETFSQNGKYNFTEIKDIDSSDEIIAKLKNFSGAEIVYVIKQAIESEFSRILKQLEQNKEEDDDDDNNNDVSITISRQNILNTIECASSSIMFNQQSLDKSQLTPIQEIDKMYKVYKFKHASQEVNPQNPEILPNI